MGGKTSKGTVENKPETFSLQSQSSTECADITNLNEKIICEAKIIDVMDKRKHELLDSITQKECAEKAKGVEEHKWCTMEYKPRIQAGGFVNGSKYIRYKIPPDMLCDYR